MTPDDYDHDWALANALRIPPAYRPLWARLAAAESSRQHYYMLLAGVAGGGP